MTAPRSTVNRRDPALRASRPAGAIPWSRRSWLARLVEIAFLALPISCGDPVVEQRNASTDCESALALSFVPEIAAPESEAYVCFAFEVPGLANTIVRGVQWVDPKGGTILHHAKLSVTSELRPTQAPFDCDPMPSDAFALHVWVPGGSPLKLPVDVGLELPPGARTLIVEAHVLRVSAAPAGTASVSLCRTVERPPKVAAWLGLQAPVPAIRPHYRESSVSRCDFSAAFHVLFAWPHMHLIGAEFHAARITPTERTPVLDVVPWDFSEQRTYDTRFDVQPNDAVETGCTWENPTAEYVLPGIFTKDEMCSLGLIGWPREGANCSYE